MLLFRPGLLVLLGCIVASAGAAGETITVGPQPCAALAPLAPAPDVAYSPGVDVEGRPVAPADLPGSGDPAFSQYLTGTPIEITAALRKRYGIKPEARLFRGRAEIGYVTVRDGIAYLDDVPLSPPETALLAAACRGQR